MGKPPIQLLNTLPQIAIAGVGLLGGSIGLALKNAGYQGRVLGIGRRQTSLDIALQTGCIDASALETDSPWAFDRQTLVILATPIRTFEAHLREISNNSPPDTIITDAGSTKAMVCQWARDLLRQPQCFVGAHPMAGSEKQGPEHADGSILKDRPVILTPDDTTDSHALEVVTAMWQSTGMRIVTMDARDHDLAVAAISHLPHALAVLIVQSAAAQAGALDVAAGGFRDTTRVASGDVQVWQDIFTTNRAALVAKMDAFLHVLTTLRDQLAAGNDDYIKEQLTQAKTIRDHWQSHQGRSLPPRPPQ